MRYKFWAEVEGLLEESLQDISKESVYFYKNKIVRFFTEYMSRDENQNKPMKELSYLDIQIYLDGLGYPIDSSGYENFYSALSKFFGFTHVRYKTPELMARVRKPERKRKEIEYISHNDITKLLNFVFDKKGNIEEKVLVAILLFTGLKREYIDILTFNNVNIEQGIIQIEAENGIELTVPIAAPLLSLIEDMWQSLEEKNASRKIIPERDSEINRVLSHITKKVCGKKFTPQMFSYTFINKCSEKELSITTVSNLVDLQANTISKHFTHVDKEEVIRNALDNLYID